MANVPFSTANIRKREPLFQNKARVSESIFNEGFSSGCDGGRTGIIDYIETFSKATLDIMGVAILDQEFSTSIVCSTWPKAVQAELTSNSSEAYSFYQAYHILFALVSMGKSLTFSNGFFTTRWLRLEANRELKFAMK